MDMIKRIVKRFRGMYDIYRLREVRILPAYIAFYFLLSFIPLLTLILTSLTLIDRVNVDFMFFLQEIFPENVHRALLRLVSYFNTGVNLFTINNILLLYSTSRIYYSIYHANAIILKTKCCRHFLLDKFIALFSTLVILLTIFIIIIFFGLGQYVNQFLNGYFIWSNFLSVLLSSTIAILAMILFTTVIMLSLPDNHFQLRRVWRGSITTALLMVISSFGFRVYVEKYANYDSVYYTFSTILIFVLWIYLMSTSIIIGLIVNAYANQKFEHKKE